MLLKIKLYILSFNKINMRHDILSTNKDSLEIPYLEIKDNDQDQSLDSLLSSVFEKYVDLSGSFIRYKLCEASLSKNNLSLYYFCLVPFNTQIKNSFFLNNNTIHNNDTKILSNIIKLL